jgi:hypothetical protein
MVSYSLTGMIVWVPSKHVGDGPNSKRSNSVSEQAATDVVVVLVLSDEVEVDVDVVVVLVLSDEVDVDVDVSGGGEGEGPTVELVVVLVLVVLLSDVLSPTVDVDVVVVVGHSAFSLSGVGSAKHSNAPLCLKVCDWLVPVSSCSVTWFPS